MRYRKLKELEPSLQVLKGIFISGDTDPSRMSRRSLQRRYRQLSSQTANGFASWSEISTMENIFNPDGNSPELETAVSFVILQKAVELKIIEAALLTRRRLLL